MTEWKFHIYRDLREIQGKPGERLRRLAFDFPVKVDGEKAPLSIDEVSEVTPQVARYYATYSERTLRRDLDALVKRKIVARDGDRYYSNWRSIMGLLPKGAILSNENVGYAMVESIE